MQLRSIVAFMFATVSQLAAAVQLDKDLLTNGRNGSGVTVDGRPLAEQLTVGGTGIELIRNELQKAGNLSERASTDVQEDEELWPWVQKVVDALSPALKAAPAAPVVPDPMKLKVLCVVVCRTTEEFLLVNEMERQLRQCDDYVVASNRTISPQFRFKAKPLIKGPMDSIQASYLGAGALNTGIFIQLWKALAARKDISSFDWIVKLDPDTFFRPSSLKLALSKYGTQPVIVAHRPNNATDMPGAAFLSLDHYPVRGDPSIWYTSRLWSMYAISSSFFQIYLEHGCDVPASVSPHEDMWWGECMKTEPYEKKGAHLAPPEGRCVDFAWNAYVWKPKGYNGGRFPITAEMVNDLRNGKTLYHEQGFCMSPNISSFHPVKSPVAYRKLRRMFEGASTAKYWDERTFLPVKGWSVNKASPSGKLLKCGCLKVKTDRVKCLAKKEPLNVIRKRAKGKEASQAASCFTFSDEDKEHTMYSGSGSGTA